jgi:hypothetical protein
MFVPIFLPAFFCLSDRRPDLIWALVSPFETLLKNMAPSLADAAGGTVFAPN